MLLGQLTFIIIVVVAIIVVVVDLFINFSFKPTYFQ